MEYKIIPYEDCSFKTGEIIVDDVVVTYMQTSDCDQTDDEPQVLKLSTRNNGVARFISFETKRWSIDSIDELIKIFNDFKRRASLKDGKQTD